MTSIAKTRPTRRSPPRVRVNWPLWMGLLLVGLVALLAFRGPDLAPKDPLEENLIVRDTTTGKWHLPPFPAFSVTGFPLGSDEFGRDLYSRLLFAVRPTFQMVLLVAGVRLVLGTLIGLVAGWSTGRAGGFFDTLISSALALPGLLVALGAIAIVGVELGVFAFIIGLSVTGWAETARLVREQTRSIRTEVYVEAAHALGATDPQIVFRHVVRQIRAMLLMLFAFEVGSTLMLTAGLGFLGYYIGGDVWVDVDDFVARRTSGNPELGQMLATAWVRLTDPWGLVSVGTVVFAAVLGFNLIGEGLRLRIDPEAQVGRLRWLSDGLGRLRLNLEQAWHPVGGLLFGTRLAVTLWAAALGAGTGYAAVRAWQSGALRLPEPQTNLFFEQREPTPTPPPTPEAGPAPEDNGSAAPTETTASGGPLVLSADESGWLYTAPAPLLVHPLTHPNGSTYLLTDASEVIVLDASGSPSHRFDLPDPVHIAEQLNFTGGTIEEPFPPLLSPDGAVIVVSTARLYAVGLDGQVAWEIPLDDVPHASPIAGPDGETYYQLDRQGSLYAFSPLEGLRWKHDLEEGLRPAFFFPVFSPLGDVFYSITNGTRGHIEALAPDGSFRWRTALTTFNFYRPMQISPAGDWISLDDNVVRTETGELIELVDSPFSVDQFTMGRDGKTYLLSGSTVMEWTLGPGGRLNVVRQTTVARPPNATTGLPPRLDVTEDGTIWIRHFGTGGRHVIYTWAGFDGTVYNIVTVNLREGFLFLEDYAAVRVGSCFVERAEERVVCQIHDRTSPEPVWEVHIEGISRALSVEYRDGVLHLQTEVDTVRAVRVEIP